MKKLVLVGFSRAYLKNGGRVCRLTRESSSDASSSRSSHREREEKSLKELFVEPELENSRLFDFECDEFEDVDVDSSSVTSSVTLANHIHQLLDDTVTDGNTFAVEVLWVWTSQHNKDKSLRLHSLLYGALRRAVEWHHASVTVVHSVKVDRFALKEWSQAVPCSTVCRDKLSCWTNVRMLKFEHQLVWCGYLHFAPQKHGGESAPLLHCELYRHSTETATDLLTAVTCTTSWLEVVSIIRETEIPLGVLTSCTSYSLACLNSLHVDGSALSQLKKTMISCNICFLVRFCYVEADGLASPRFLSQWMEFVVGADDSHFASASDCHMDLLSPQGCLLLVVADGSAAEPVLRVYTLCSAADLHVAMSLVVGDSSEEMDCSVMEQVASVISEIPHYDNVRMLEEQSPSKRKCDTLLKYSSELLHIANTDLNVCPLLPLEKLALQTEERILRSLVAATSPNPLLDTLLAPNPADLHLNLEEMLQLFDGDGKALSLSLPAVSAGNSSLRLKPHRSYSSADHSELKSLSFYDAARLSAHGVNYCVDEHASLSIDRRLARIQLRYVSSETNSTCATASTPAIQIGKRRSQITYLTPPQTKPKRMKTTSELMPRKGPRKRLEPQTKVRTSPRKISRMPPVDRRKRVSRTNDTRSDKSIKLEGQLKSHTVKTQSKMMKMEQSAAKSLQGEAALDKEITTCTTNVRRSSKMTRSERHKQCLLKVVHQTLKHFGLQTKDVNFQRCVDRLFHICHGYLKDLKSSKNLKEEMVTVAEQNAQQVVKFEKRWAESIN
ncbi:uncharacterized protein LOC134183349 isoform X2 [Corticium candelabrum]|uniref:uncharacterized protein LOC134183349 isoform X2 n=1 Tax=Corticium candelabrum TaxID=121492 RepID=UPI002E26A1B5|nr:uncharacterized protein LOC134183349 isoform X2 [Corticium candelabrum]